MCKWYPVCEIRPNYEVVGFQSWSGTNTALVYFAYCCVTFYTPSLLLYPPPYPRSPLSLPSCHPAGHRSNPDISPAQVPLPTWVSPLSVPESPTSIQVHLPTWASPASVPEYQNPHSPAPAVPPCPPLRVPITPSPTPVFLKYFLQGFPKLCLWSFLSPQRIPPAPYPFIACIPCKYLEYLPQIHPL